MKLPDFSEFVPFNKLRKDMGAKNLGTFDLNYNWKPITASEVKELATQGLDVDKDKIKTLPDGSLVYKNKRILVYIRDVKSYKGEETLPKFHIADCSTLKTMNSMNRFNSRYVVATRTDGYFVVRKNGFLKPEVKLFVCKNCLSELNFNNFNEDKWSAFKNFSLEDFFIRYTCSPVLIAPRETDRTALINEYPHDWKQKSRDYRKSVEWKCEKCGIDLSKKELRQFLHAHHINGNQYYSQPSNLKALCIDCHSKELFHAHMRDLPDLKKYWEIIGRVRGDG